MDTEDTTADSCKTDTSGGATENATDVEMNNTDSTAATAGDTHTDINDHSDNIAAADEEEVARDEDREVVEDGGGIEKAAEEDLEEGECTSDDEPEPAPVTMVMEVKEEKRRNEKKHRRTRSRSRDRHKRSKRSKEKKELDEDEKKKREVLRKLKALEENMGLIDEWAEDEETPAASEESEEYASSDVRSRSGSRSSSESPGRRRSRERRKREREKRHAKKRKREREGHGICQMFMQGKCQKTAKECIFSHDAEPPQVWELCKFYLRDRCAKRDKCLYLHKGFPCKFFHTGRACGFTAETCQFSHEPLNDMTRSLILKHIETAPKDILGEFPRMTRTEAANAIFQTEAKNKGWITEGPNAVKPPEVSVEPAPDRMELEEAPGDRLEAPSHIKLDPIQEKLLKASQQEAGLTGSSRWSGGQDQEAGPPPLAVQQAMAMTGTRSHPASGGHGIQSHGVMRNNGAFAPAPPSQRRQTVGLLGPAPEGHWSGSPFGAGGYSTKQPPGLMDVKVNEEEVATYLIKQRIVAAKVHEEFNEPSDDETGENSGTGGDETPEVTPPNSREGSPFGDQNIPPNLPKAQMKLLQRIQQKQKDRQDTDSNNDHSQGEDGQNEDWYGDEEEDKGDKEEKTEVGAPFTLNNLNLPNGLTNMLTAIRAGASTSPGQEKGGIGFQQPPPVTPEKKSESRRQDPRRNRNDPRNRTKKESEEEIERKKDERIMDLDLGSLFGDLELPPLTVSPERTEEEKSFTDALGLPFKPHIIHEVAKEIDASYDSHSPIDWVLRPMVCSKPDYTDIKHLFSNAQLEADPRLRRFAKSGMAKMKELPLPSFPTPKTDPRLKRKEAASTPAQSEQQSAPQRRRSSEDGEGGQVYNPAKELSRAKQQVPPVQPQVETEAYSPGQEYQEHPPPAGDPGQEAYDPYDDQEANYGGPPPPPGDFGHPPPNFPPPPGQPPFDPHQGYPPPPQGNWARPPPGRGFPPRGQPPPDPYYQGPPGGPYGAPFGPPRGKFNGPPRGNFNNRGFPQNRERSGGGGGGFGNQRRKDPRKRH